MHSLARRFLVVLIVFAIVGGPTVHVAQPAEYAAPITMADIPCDQMVPATDTGPGTPMIPCKGLTPDCLKQMGCVADVALPTRSVALGAVLAYAEVSYWA